MDLKKWVSRNQKLRDILIRKEIIKGTLNSRNKYLLANFSGTAQGKDIEKRTALINDFFRIKINVKAFSEAEMKKIGKNLVDFSNSQEVSNALRDEFDMPEWAYLTMKNRPLVDYNNVLIYQLKGCNIFCPWCYVDDINKNSKKDNNSDYFSISEIVDVFQEERKKQPLYMIRPSGGEPTLAVEQWLEVLRELEKRGIEKEVYIQGDTNLTTGHFIESLEKTNQIKKNILNEIGGYKNFGVLCSFKGTDAESFLKACGFVKKDGTQNINYSFLEKERWYSFEKLIKSGIDAYPFIYNPNPESLESFIEKGIRKFSENFLLKTRMFKLKLYDPEKERYQKQGKNPENEQTRLNEDYEKSYEILDNLVQKRFGIPYGSTSRAGIKLELK